MLIFWRFLFLMIMFNLVSYTQKSKPIALKIMSYNIQHGINTQGKTNLLRVVDIIKKHKPDLVALQEIDSGMVQSGRLNQIRILSLLTGYNGVLAKTIGSGDGKVGLGILSKWPIEGVQQIKLPHIQTQTDSCTLFCALIALNDTQYCRFCNTQLDDFSPLNRGLQAAVANEALQYSIQPVILAGNMNVQPLDHTLEGLFKYWNDAGENTDAGTYSITGKRIDYIWTLKESTFKLVDYRVLYEPNTSDHSPVIATFELRQK